MLAYPDLCICALLASGPKRALQREAERAFGLSYGTTQKTIFRLEDSGILSRIVIGNRGRDHYDYSLNTEAYNAIDTAVGEWDRLLEPFRDWIIPDQDDTLCGLERTGTSPKHPTLVLLLVLLRINQGSTRDILNAARLSSPYDTFSRFIALGWLKPINTTSKNPEAYYLTNRRFITLGWIKPFGTTSKNPEAYYLTNLGQQKALVVLYHLREVLDRWHKARRA